MNIRLANLKDAPALARVIVDTKRAAYRGQIPDAVLLKPSLAEEYVESEDAWNYALHEIADSANPLEHICVAEDETGAVIGLCMGGPPKTEILPKSGEVYALFVLPSHQGRGVGQTLVRAVAAHLDNMGMSSLLIGCLAANMSGRRFYEAIGGRVVAERTAELNGILLPELVYGWEDSQIVIRKGRTDGASFEPYHLTQTDLAVDADRAFLSAQLKQFNNLISPHHLHIRTHPSQPLDLFLRTNSGEIVAGLVADTYWTWLVVEDFWIQADLRGQGYGRQLLALAEAVAQKRGCHYAQLTTYSFQARCFYEKAGYRVVGTMEDYPPGATYFWLRKDFAANTGT